MSDDAVLRAEGLYKSYTEGDLSVDVLRNIKLTVAAGERIAIIGASGSGKSTLLHVMGGLDHPDRGAVFLAGEDLAAISELERSRARNQRLGFVYQFHHLLAEFSAVENVAIPLIIGGMAANEAQSRAAQLLTQVGLAERLTHKPGELSGGERQRAAIARALVNRPDCLLADEPTGNLDRRIANDVFELMLEMNREVGTALVAVTHDLHIAERMDRVLELVDGNLRPY
jgi:lipoprotein-releasing system ATP-binding protein